MAEELLTETLSVMVSPSMRKFLEEEASRLHRGRIGPVIRDALEQYREHVGRFDTPESVAAKLQGVRSVRDALKNAFEEGK